MEKSIWIELIGFDKDAPDFKIGEYLETTGFIPERVSLHLTSINFVNCHRGMEEEYVLPDYVCSYNGREKNDLRSRQRWTNYDLRAFIKELQKKNIKVFASFFDFDSNGDFGHPELLCECDNVIMMIKRFKDGLFYEDFLAEKIVETVKDYGLDGVQLADGISSARWSMWTGDFSDDLLEQAGISVPENENRAEYIQKNYTAEWIEFYTKRWSAFLEKIMSKLKENGILIAVNSAWTRESVEAMFRYGCDYSVIDKYADYFIVEDVASDLAILGEDDCGYKYSYDERKMIHYEFIANLMCIKAHIKNAKITPLFPIWDNMEQWDVINHAPTAMERATISNFSHFVVKDRLYPVTDGPHFCLGDGLTKEKWKFIGKCLENAQIENVAGCDGATFIYSRKKAYKEVFEYAKYGIWHSSKWLANLLRKGGAVYTVADIEDIEKVTGDIVIANYSLLDDDEKSVIDEYKGRVIKLESKKDENFTFGQFGWWTRPLSFTPVSDLDEKIEEINKNINAKVVFEKEECNICEIVTGEKTSVIVAENSEYYYILPVIKTEREIKSIKAITKSQAYPLKFDSHSIKIRIPPRGADVILVEYR